MRGLMVVPAMLLLVSCSAPQAAPAVEAPEPSGLSRQEACSLLDERDGLLRDLRYTQDADLEARATEITRTLGAEAPEPMRAYVLEINSAMHEIPLNMERAARAAHVTGFDELDFCSGR